VGRGEIVNRVLQTSPNTFQLAPKGGRAAGLHTYKSKFKNTGFVDKMISKVLRDLPFSRSQPLKWLMTSTSEFWKINQKSVS
jgi:hypothetical protein